MVRWPVCAELPLSLERGKSRRVSAEVGWKEGRAGTSLACPLLKGVSRSAIRATLARSWPDTLSEPTCLAGAFPAPEPDTALFYPACQSSPPACPAESTDGPHAGPKSLASLMRTQHSGMGKLGWRSGHSGEGDTIGPGLPWVLGVCLCWDVQAEATSPPGRNHLHLRCTGLGRLSLCTV